MANMQSSGNLRAWLPLLAQRGPSQERRQGFADHWSALAEPDGLTSPFVGRGVGRGVWDSMGRLADTSVMHQRPGFACPPKTLQTTASA
jgi:hypothetical protein